MTNGVLGDFLVDYLRQFDAGVAPTMEDIVNATMPVQPQEVRRTVAGLESAGWVRSRWDGDAQVFWAPPRFNVGDHVRAKDPVARQMHATGEPDWPAHGQVVRADGAPHIVWVRDPLGGEWGLPAHELEHIEEGKE